jgi:hypothetical protein
MIFNPIRTREVTPGAIARALATEHDVTRPMGNVAASELAECIRAWLVGFSTELMPVVHRSNEWLSRAIYEDEKFGVNHDLHRATLHQARALGEWMESGRNSEEQWNQARLYEEAAWQNASHPWSTKDVLQDGLNDYMAFSCEGGHRDECAEAGIAVFERWTGIKEISPKKLLKPREFGYALCLHLARQKFDKEDLLKAGRKMLQANLEEKWLGSGQYRRAATWLKVVHGHCGEVASPLQTIIKAYDDMPNVVRPEFL